jgi:zinc protease
MRSSWPLTRRRRAPLGDIASEPAAPPQARRQAIPLALLLAVLLGSLAAAPALALNVEEITSRQGIKAWLVEEHSVPLVAIRFAFMGGSCQDPDGSEGLAAMMSDLLTEGAGELPAPAFKERLAELGTHLTTASGRDGLYGGMEALSKRFAPSVELLRIALTSPRFDADAVERIRAQRLTDLALAANNPTKLARNRWYAEAFSGHPYGRPLDGTPESIAAITPAALKTMHGKLFGKDVLKVVIVGDIDKRGAAEVLDSVFGALPDRAKAAHIARIEPREVAAPVVIDKDYPLATAVFGLPSLSGDSPDFAALQVLNHVIGSGDFDSRLMEEVRVKRGLAYSIQTSLLRDSVTSLLVGGLATKNEVMGTALGIVKDVLAETARNGPTRLQFDNAKQYLTGSFLLDFDTNAKVAGSLLTIQLLGEGRDYLVTRNQRIAAVTFDDVKRVAQQVLKPERMVITVVGKPKLSP